MAYLPTMRLASSMPRASVRCFSTARPLHASQSYKFVVAGGGAGGLSIASFLARNFPNQVAVIEPSMIHYYQPLWTLVGGGLKHSDASMKNMADVMPKKAHWIQDRVAGFKPEENCVLTKTGTEVRYEFLVVALGLQLNFHLVKGLPEALGMDGVGCNYSIRTVNDTFKAIQNFKNGNALFTIPATPVKCAGAPQKIMYLTEDYLRKNGLRSKASVKFMSPLGAIFSAPKYARVLDKICEERGIEVHFQRNLIAINAATKQATFEVTTSSQTPKETITLDYEMIHVTPPMGPPDVLKGSPLSDANGFVDVNHFTLQHKRFENIFALGDCANLPTSKTAAAVAGQSGVLRSNLSRLIRGKPLLAKYDGYTSCPLITAPGKCILAEFDFKLEPKETFPFDQGKERKSMYHLKADIMPHLYWELLLKGYWGGPEPYRKAMHLGFK